MAEVCAQRGYVEASVERVAKRAGVSSVTFYKQFADKRDCLLAAHWQLLGRLLEEVDGARDDGNGELGLGREAMPPEARARTVLRAALALFAADPPSARLLTVEVLAAGREGAQRHDAMVEAFAGRLDTDWVRAAGILALAGKLVLTGEADRLPQLEDELVATLS
jgi:AcrR family transcriptional regulator